MRRTGLLVAAGLALAACRQDVPGDPPRLVPGRDACARCGMAVSETRFAAGWVAQDGSSVLFDDAGEFLAALAERPGRAAQAWAGDFETGRWLRAREAAFVRAPGLATPMGTGVAAFSSSAAARAFLLSRPGAEQVLLPAAPRPERRDP